MKRIVLYDVARLINRAKAPNPTGIDRVDIRYLEHFRADPDTRLVGVVQKRGRLVAVPDRELRLIWDLLSDRWLEGRPATPAEKREQRLLKLRSTLRSFRSRFWRWRSGTPQERRLAPEIVALCDANPVAQVVFVNCSHNGIKTPDLFTAMRARLRAWLVFYVHDMIPIEFPQYVRAGFDARHAQRMAIVGQVADAVLTNSAYSRDRFVAFCAARNIAAPPVTVLHIGCEPSFLDRAAQADPTVPADRPYFVAVGTIEPRKNLALLLKAWAILRSRDETVPQLRLIGRRGWVTEANADFDVLLADVADDVVELASVGDVELVAQIAGARALLFPSFVEGWGMPLVEAQVIGTPVIASDIDAFTEAGQGLSLLLSSQDPAVWADAIARYADPDDPTRQQAADALGAFLPPQWTAHFEGLERALAGLPPVGTGRSSARTGTSPADIDPNGQSR